MEAPPLSAAPTTNIITPTAAAYPESIDSSPRSRQTNSWDAEPPRPQKLRLMCSYGGHIVPRPHDKTLCYIGGDTRIIVIDRHGSISDLRLHLSKTLLHNQPFILKYQLPNEDLDSLISVATEEDLENMVEEYDRLNNAAAAAKNGRLRVFLFPKTSSNNIEQLLVETASTKSEDWFFNALNGKGSTLSAGASDRGFSESSSVNNLLGLDDDLLGKAAVTGKDAEPQIEGSKSGGNGNNNNSSVINNSNHDVNSSVPDSQLLETSSSFGSTSSSPSVANLPPIRVHVDENPKLGLGIEDHLQQMNLGVSGNVNLVATQKQDEVAGFVAAGTLVSGIPAIVGGEYPNRVFSGDERPDQGGFRKVQQIQPQVQQIQPQVQHQLPIPQFQQKPAAIPFDLASPDSVSSEGSITNPLSRQRQAMYQESPYQVQSGNSMVASASNPTDPKTIDQNNPKIQIQDSNYIVSGQFEQNHPQVHYPQQFIHAGNQYIPSGNPTDPKTVDQNNPKIQIQDSNYIVSGQFEQNHPQVHHPQQFIHAGNQYIPAGNQYIPAGAMPVASYYPVYPSQQQNRPHQPVLDHQYPFYFVPARQTQGYNIPMQQTNYNELPPTNTPSTRPQTPPTVIAPHVPYNQSRPEMSTGVYRTAAASGPQYVGFTQIPHPSQSMAPSSVANSNYTYEFTDPNHTQMYYNQALPPQLSGHYQTHTAGPGVVVPDASGQVPMENMKQQVRNMQP